ncbi:aminodeoxychorismate synthase component I [Haloechinothrix salitolerans]|uniref:Aminodeoxychorismate synthase component I n=1 Tax=Haloechinothrix salitolerans TaxID=926830 RepID=A0ABW2BWA3_9PSEU
MRLERMALRTGARPEQVLSLLDARARRLGLPAPAALIGDWFGSRAVIAPTVELRPVTEVAEAFATPARQRAVNSPADGAIGGGWFGYLGYDLTDPSGRSGALPPAAWGWADHVLRLDTTGQWWLETLGPELDALAAEFDALLDVLSSDDAPDVLTEHGWTATRLRRPDGSEHTKAVAACMDAIADGELFQANICARFHGEFDGSACELFTAGVRRLRPRRAAYLAGSWGAVVSLSPELFLARTGRRVRSTPIKGTLPRRGDADAANAERLRRSTKDVAENVMITDLVRNDLGRVSAVGSVTVPELLSVTEAPGVWHLESTVASELAPDMTDADLLHATFPPGSVTGAPKLRALDLIAELEPEARGVYCGAAGLVSPAAGMELNVAIRTLEVADGAVALGVGGGITALSDPAAEWQECLHKAAPLEALLRHFAAEPT